MKNKKLFAILTLVCFLFTLMPMAAFAGSEDTVILKVDSKNVYKNGEVMTTDVAPTIVDGRTLVPVRIIMEALGGEVDWYNDTRTVVITIDDKVMSLVINKEIPGYGTGAIIIDGRTMVPIRYVSEYVGYEVEWIESTRQIIITNAKKVTEYTVTFDLNTSGEGVIDTVAVEEGQTVDKPEIEYKSGKVFHGWYTNDEGKGEPFDFSTPIYSDLVLYGHWSAQSYGGGSYTPSVPPTPGHTHSYVVYESNNDGTHKVQCACGTVQNATEECTATIDGYKCACGTYVVDTNEELKTVLTKEDANIVVKLTADVTYDVTAWQNNAMGGASTETVTINGNGNTITFNQTNSDWSNIATSNGAKLVINNAYITNSGHNDGPWNRHDLNFACDVELNNVTSDKALAFKAGATLNTVTINDANNSDTYAIWIQPNGQTVTLNNVTIDMLDCTDGRGITINDQYVSSPEKVILNVNGATFKTEEKSAIIVKSTAGADITLTGTIDISGVVADSTNVVWVDADRESSKDLVTVTGGTKIVES